MSHPAPSPALRAMIGAACGLAIVGAACFFIAAARNRLPMQSGATTYAAYQWYLHDDALSDTLPVAPARSLDTDHLAPVVAYMRAGGVRVVNAGAGGQLEPADTFTQNELHTSGRVFLVESGTPCIVSGVDTANGAALVQIAGGVHAGESGVVYAAWVQRDERVAAGLHRVRIDGKPSLVDRLKGYGQIIMKPQNGDADPTQYP